MKSIMQFPRFIHFFGPDGSGKTTQVKILVDFLQKKGVRVKKCWVRSPHTIAFVLWMILVKIGFYRVVLNPFDVPTKLPAIDRTRALRSFWTIVEFLGVLPIIWRVHISILNGYRIVAERFVLDTIVTVAYFIDDFNFLRGSISRLLLRCIPKNTVFVFLDADYHTIYRRRAPLFGKKASLEGRRRNYGDIPTSAVEPQVFIEFQRTAYKILAKSFDSLAIDTSKHSVEETSKMILRYLEINQ